MLVAWAFCAAFPSFARAQDGAPTASDDECPHAALYEAAFDQFADGRLGEAEAALVQVITDCPGYRGAEDLLRHVRERAARPSRSLDVPIAAAVPATYAAEAPAPPQGEQPSDLARVELAIVQGLYGVFHGGWACGTGFGCDAWGFAGTMFGSAALFTGAAVLAGWEGLADGQATVANASSFFGTWLGFATWMAAGAPSPYPGGGTDPTALLTVLGGGLVGTGIGALLAGFVQPNAGQVALTSSGGLWGGALGGLLSLIGSPGFYEEWHFGLSQLIGVPVGLTAGLVASLFYPVSRGRMLLVDLGTFLAIALGAGAAALTSYEGNGHFGEHLGIWTSVMLPVGFATTMIVTHSMDAPANMAERVSVIPSGPGGPGVTVSIEL